MRVEQWEQRSWALKLVEHTWLSLRQEYTSRGQEPLFEQLHRLLTENEGQSSYSQVAEALGMSQGAVKMAAHRLRTRYWELLRARLTQELGPPESAR